MKEIAVHHCIHRVTVSEVLERAGTTKREKGMSDAQMAVAAKMYESGLSLAIVGKQLGFNATTIRTTLLRHGLTMRDSRGMRR
jgi:hypothetical protein